MTKLKCRLRHFNTTGKSPKVCQVAIAKIFLFFRNPNQRYITPHPVPIRGALANVINVGRDAVGAHAATDERGMKRKAKSCGPGAAVLALSVR